MPSVQYYYHHYNYSQISVIDTLRFDGMCETRMVNDFRCFPIIQSKVTRVFGIDFDEIVSGVGDKM